VTASFDGRAAKKVLSIGIPAAVQGAVFGFANIFIQASVNTFGSTITAGSTIAMNFEYFAYYMITAFAQAATTFTAANISAGNEERCRKILVFSLIEAAVMSSLIVFPLSLGSDFFSAIFSSNRAVIRASACRNHTILIFETSCCLYEVLAGTMRGRGHSALPAVINVVGIAVFRVLWIATAFQMTQSLKILYMAFPISWTITNAGMLLAASETGVARCIKAVPADK